MVYFECKKVYRSSSWYHGYPWTGSLGGTQWNFLALSHIIWVWLLGFQTPALIKNQLEARVEGGCVTLS